MKTNRPAASSSGYLQRLLLQGLACVLVGLCSGCPYNDYPSMPHRDVAYGPNASAPTCQTCHRGQGRAENLDEQACLRCHQPIADQLREKRGHHGAIIAKAGSPNCGSCHHEHSGPNWPSSLISWSASEQRAFAKQHGSVTGFPLDGGHDVACAQCHNRKRPSGLPTFSGLRARCASCHLAQSPHGPLRELRDACERCHVSDAWRHLRAPLEFDHDQDTLYALRGPHKQIECQRCHLPAAAATVKDAKSASGPLFKLAEERFRDCQPCHADRNPHGGSFGPRLCSGCHASDRGWKARAFRHLEEAGFPLLGKHAEARCADCHRREQSEPPQRRCATCHGRDNVHGARFDAQGDCSSCHHATDWRDNAFDHPLRAGFALDNHHSANSLDDCSKCHRRIGPNGFESLRAAGTGDHIDCRGCHAHRQQHHDSRTREQRTKPCLLCHEQAGSSRLARALRASDVASEAEVNRQSWFGHGTVKPFRLIGGHALASLRSCSSCHKNPKSGFSKLPTDCVSCHKAQDAHAGSLSDCGRCHDPAVGSFKRTPRLNHDAVFKLEGRHATAACAGCHPSGDRAKQYRGRPTLCGAGECHQRNDTLHQGSRGSQCGSSDCHSPLYGGWKIPKFHQPTSAIPPLELGPGAHK